MYTPIDKEKIFNEIGVESFVNMLFKDANEGLNGNLLKYARQSELEDKDVELSDLSFIPEGPFGSSTEISYMKVKLLVKDYTIYVGVIQKETIARGKRYILRTDKLVNGTNSFHEMLFVSDQCFVIKRTIEEIYKQFELRYIIGEV